MTGVQTCALPIYKETLTFILLNPSTADENDDDPATNKCVEIANDHEFGRVEIVNLFSAINSSSDELTELNDPLRSENDEYIMEACERADKIVCGWGNDGQYMNRSEETYSRISDYDLWCLRQNSAGDGEPTYVNPNGPLRHEMDNELQPYVRH